MLGVFRKIRGIWSAFAHGDTAWALLGYIGWGKAAASAVSGAIVSICAYADGLPGSLIVLIGLGAFCVVVWAINGVLWAKDRRGARANRALAGGQLDIRMKEGWIYNRSDGQRIIRARFSARKGSLARNVLPYLLQIETFSGENWHPLNPGSKIPLQWQGREPHKPRSIGSEDYFGVVIFCPEDGHRLKVLSKAELPSLPKLQNLPVGKYRLTLCAEGDGGVLAREQFIMDWYGDFDRTVIARADANLDQSSSRTV